MIISALAYAACGSKNDEVPAPTEKQGADPSAESLPATIRIIDDFEKLSAPLPGLVSIGEWYGFDDASVQDPNDPKKQVIESEALLPPQPTLSSVTPSTRALRARGGPYEDWGSGFTHPLAGQTGFDASAYEGVLFWAKKGTPTASSLLTITLPTADDTPTSFGGRCMEQMNAATGGCYDQFHLDVDLSDDWRVYKIAFRELHQTGFGYVPPDGFDKKTVMSVTFENAGKTTFDEVIDDVAFYSNDPEATGAGGAQNDASMGGGGSTGQAGGTPSDAGTVCRKTRAPAITGQDIAACKAGLADAGADSGDADGGDDTGLASCFACLCINCPMEANACLANQAFCKSYINECCRSACKCPSAADY
jgi:hypothetical protein